MFDYCGVYIGVSTRFSPLFNFDFSLAINSLGKQNVGKIFLSNFFFKRTYSGAFETAAIGPLSLKRPIAVLLKLLLKLILKTYSGAFETTAIG